VAEKPPAHPKTILGADHPLSPRGFREKLIVELGIVDRKAFGVKESPDRPLHLALSVYYGIDISPAGISNISLR
jgi:hypothetical protein